MDNFSKRKKASGHPSAPKGVEREKGDGVTPSLSCSKRIWSLNQLIHFLYMRMRQAFKGKVNCWHIVKYVINGP